jgi:broad specificity phosphatase PhoE
MQRNTQKFIVLLRHGQSTANHEGVVQGQRDYPLHEAGIRQVKRLADFWSLRSQTFDQIIYSPLLRAKHTAEILAAALEIPLQENPIWIERRLGDAEGLPYGQIQATLSGRLEHQSSYEPLFESGESEWDLFTRAAKAIQSLLDCDIPSILVVSHGAILSAVMRAILGISPPPGHTRPPGFRFDNTGYSEVVFDQKTSHWIILSHNTKHHLEQDE